MDQIVENRKLKINFSHDLHKMTRIETVQRFITDHHHLIEAILVVYVTCVILWHFGEYVFFKKRCFLPAIHSCVAGNTDRSGSDSK